MQQQFEIRNVPELSTLRSVIRSSLRPSHHVFEYRNTRLLYDILTGTLLEISEAAFTLLSCIEYGEDDAAIQVKMDPLGGDVELRKIIHEILTLARIGFFCVEAEDVTKKQNAAVAALMNHRPRKMMLMIQTNCNLKCSYCYEVLSGLHQPGRSMDLDVGKRTIDFLIKRAGRRKELEVTFFGGEPLMNFPLMKQ